MTPQRARELLGGLATGILTPEERQTLFEAALHDQALFNEVADELEFAAFLQSPETRAQLANRIETEPSRRRWWPLSPAWFGLSATLAASAVVFVAVWHHQRNEVFQDAAAIVPPAPPGIAAPAPPMPKTETADAKTPAPAPRDKATARRVEAGTEREVVVGAARPSGALQHSKTGAARQPGAGKPQQSEAGVALQPGAEGPQQSGAGAGRLPGPGAPRQSGAGAARQPGPGAPQQSEAGAARQPRPEGPQQPEAGAGRQPGAGAPQQSGAGTARQDALKAPPVNEPRPLAATPAAMQPAPAPPPPVTATIEGTVRDPAGVPLRNANIHIVNTATNAATDTVTGTDGRFAANSLPPGGPYTVIAQASGFRNETRGGITLAADQPAQIDLALQVGSVASAVEVTAARAPIASFGAMQRPAAAKAAKAAKAGIAGEAPRQVAVLDFVSDTPQSLAGQQAADLLSNRLLASGQLRVIDRQRVQQAQSRAQLQPQPSGQSQFAQAAPVQPPSPNDAARLGRALGADAVIVGRVTSAPNVALVAEVIDTRNAQPMPMVQATAPSLEAAANLLGPKVESQLTPPIEGTVTSVNATKVNVSFRAPAEPHIGMRFNVMRDNRKIGELTVTSADGQSAAGKFSGFGQPRAGDRVTSSPSVP